MGCHGSKSDGAGNKGMTLFIWPGSAPCRAVMMTAMAANINMEVEKVNIFKGEHKTNPYTKLNPDQTVPTLKDSKENKLISNSHAIMMYLIDTYAPDHPLYPQDLDRRKPIDKYLKYDLKTVYPAISSWLYPQIFGNQPSDEKKEEEVRTILTSLDNDLAESPYLAHKSLSIADLAVMANISLLELIYYDVSSWKNLWSWIQKVKDMAYYAPCNKGLEDWKLVLHIREQNRRDRLERDKKAKETEE